MPKKEEKLQEKDIENMVESDTSQINEEIAEEVPESIDSLEKAEIDESNETEINQETLLDESDLDATVTVQPVKFASFEELNKSQGELNKNLEILMDIKLQLTVELGRTELPIKKVLELTRGSIIELEKVAGEPVELYANGKLVAHGEVVVIEDNFGLRITSITEPEDRLKGL